MRGRGRPARSERTEETGEMELNAAEALGETRGLSEATGSDALGLERRRTTGGPGEGLGVMVIEKVDVSGGQRCSVFYA